MSLSLPTWPATGSKLGQGSLRPKSLPWRHPESRVLVQEHLQHFAGRRKTKPHCLRPDVRTSPGRSTASVPVIGFLAGSRGGARPSICCPHRSAGSQEACFSWDPVGRPCRALAWPWRTPESKAVLSVDIQPREIREGSTGFQGPEGTVPRRDPRRLVLTISLRNSASAASRLGGLVRVPEVLAPPPPAPPRLSSSWMRDFCAYSRSRCRQPPAAPPAAECNSPLRLLGSGGSPSTRSPRAVPADPAPLISPRRQHKRAQLSRGPRSPAGPHPLPARPRPARCPAPWSPPLLGARPPPRLPAALRWLPEGRLASSSIPTHLRPGPTTPGHLKSQLREPPHAVSPLPSSSHLQRVSTSLYSTFQSYPSPVHPTSSWSSPLPSEPHFQPQAHPTSAAPTTHSAPQTLVVFSTPDRLLTG